MGYEKLIEIRRGSSTFKEEINYIRNSEPVSPFNNEIKKIEKLLDKNFTIDVTLHEDDVHNPFIKQFGAREYVSSVDIDYRSEYLNVTVGSREIVDFILTERKFYLNTPSDIAKLHGMLMRILEKYREYNNTMGLKPLDNRMVVDSIAEFVIRLEDNNEFILLKEKRRMQERSKKMGGLDIFFNRRESRSNEENIKRNNEVDVSVGSPRKRSWGMSVEEDGIITKKF